MALSNFSSFGITGQGIDLDYCDVAWFALETNGDHSVVFIAQLVKNLPAVQETLVQFLGWEDPLEKG